MSEGIEIGDEVRTKVGKVLKVDSSECHECHLVLWQNGKEWWVPTGVVELVRKHNQPEEAVTTDKWAGVKKVKCDGQVRDVWGVRKGEHGYVGMWLSCTVCDITGIVVNAESCTPYTPPVEVGSRVRRTAGPGNTGEVLILRRKEAVYDDGNELWIAPLDELTVIE